MPGSNRSIETRAPRFPRRLWSIAAVALLVAVAVTGATCRKSRPVGLGVLAFGGGTDSVALDTPEALGINPLFDWADIEPSEGNYNWAPIDAALLAAHDKGKRVAPRIYTNAGDFSQATPQWVFDDGAGSYYFEDGATTPQPIPTDPVFTEKFAAFLQALGQRYDGNPDIEFFQTNAGMGGYGEMVWSNGDASHPPGWSPQTEVDTVGAWIDRWRGAFPHTALVLMINPIGDGIAESVSDYAVSKGFFLQSNTTDQSDEAQQIFKQHAATTKIVLEIENQGCQDATGPDFDALADKIFGYGFPIDYLTVCDSTLRDTDRLHSALARLRTGT